jgi:hypothetical protein
MTSGAAEHNANGVERGRRSRQQRQGAPRRRDRFVGAMQPGEPPPELRMSLSIGRIGFAGLADEREAFADTACFRSRDAANQQSVRAAGQTSLRDRIDS